MLKDFTLNVGSSPAEVFIPINDWFTAREREQRGTFSYSVAIKVTSGGPVYIGGETVSAGTGFPLEEGQGISIDVYHTDNVYAVAGATSEIRVLVTGERKDDEADNEV